MKDAESSPALRLAPTVAENVAISLKAGTSSQQPTPPSSTQTISQGSGDDGAGMDYACKVHGLHGGHGNLTSQESCGIEADDECGASTHSGVHVADADADDGAAIPTITTTITRAVPSDNNPMLQRLQQSGTPNERQGLFQALTSKPAPVGANVCVGSDSCDDAGMEARPPAAGDTNRHTSLKRYRGAREGASEPRGRGLPLQQSALYEAASAQATHDPQLLGAPRSGMVHSISYICQSIKRGVVSVVKLMESRKIHSMTADYLAHHATAKSSAAQMCITESKRRLWMPTSFVEQLFDLTHMPMAMNVLVSLDGVLEDACYPTKVLFYSSSNNKGEEDLGLGRLANFKVHGVRRRAA